MTTHSRALGWRALGLGAALAVAVAGCSSGGASEPTDPAASVADDATATGTGVILRETVALESSDGLVSLEIPPGVLRSDDDVGIEVVDPATVDGLEGATAIGAAYRIRPEGLRLPEPIVVTIRLPADQLAGAQSLPVVVTLVESDGAIRAEPEGRTGFDPAGDVVHLSSVDRLGTLVLVDAGIRLTLEPRQIADLEPGDDFVMTLSATVEPEAADPWPQYDLEARWAATGGVTEDSGRATTSVTGLGTGDSGDEWIVTQRFTCEEVGGGTQTAEVRVDAAGMVGGGTTRQFLRLLGESSCGDVGR